MYAPRQACRTWVEPRSGCVNPFVPDGRRGFLLASVRVFRERSHQYVASPVFSVSGRNTGPPAHHWRRHRAAVACQGTATGGQECPPHGEPSCRQRALTSLPPVRLSILLPINRKAGAIHACERFIRPPYPPVLPGLFP